RPRGRPLGPDPVLPAGRCARPGADLCRRQPDPGLPPEALPVEVHPRAGDPAGRSGRAPGEPVVSPAPAIGPGPARAWTPEVAAAIDPATDHAPEPGLAFVLHAAELLNHYREIWAHLDPATFEIVIAAE